MEAGLDSLGAVEFRSRLSQQLGDVKLPETLIFDFPTLRQVEVHVTTLLAPADLKSNVTPTAVGGSMRDLLLPTTAVHL